MRKTALSTLFSLMAVSLFLFTNCCPANGLESQGKSEGYTRKCDASFGHNAHWISKAAKFPEKNVQLDLSHLYKIKNQRQLESRGIHVFSVFSLMAGQGVCVLFWADSKNTLKLENQPDLHTKYPTVISRRYSKRQSTAPQTVD